MAQEKELGGGGEEKKALVSFFARTEPVFFLLRNQTETLATQAKDHAAIFFSVRTTAYCLGATRMTWISHLKQNRLEAT